MMRGWGFIGVTLRARFTCVYATIMDDRHALAHNLLLTTDSYKVSIVPTRKYFLSCSVLDQLHVSPLFLVAWNFAFGVPLASYVLATHVHCTFPPDRSPSVCCSSCFLSSYPTTSSTPPRQRWSTRTLSLEEGSSLLSASLDSSTSSRCNST